MRTWPDGYYGSQWEEDGTAAVHALLKENFGFKGVKLTFSLMHYILIHATLLHVIDKYLI